MNLTDSEREALERKMNTPDESVTCPRCGKELRYEEFGNSVIVECETPDCICGSIRGL